MIDHIGIHVSDGKRSKAFYVQALATLGYEIVMEWEEACGFGVAGKPDFWISPGPLNPVLHVAFRANDRATVNAFYEAALRAGGRDNGAPGIRQHYHANYYGAFVLDPDGYNIEAVTHAPEA
jgi:catechol 2,3-dioxygenase-like lactoylglutathione lyase family enzyme